MAGTTWIVVANSSTAKLYANHGPNTGLELMKEMDHPESRAKNGDLISDRPGHAMNGHGSNHPGTMPKEHEAQVFAQQLARELHDGRCGNRFERAILVAPPGFMGLIKDKLDGPTANRVSNRLEKDYTKIPARELAGRLESCIYL